MALTVEKIFNLDERIQARELINQKRNLNLGALAPKGYGALVAATSGLTDATVGPGGVFGSEDPLLKEKTALEKAMTDTQSMLTPEEMADPTKLYTVLMQNAGKSGVSARGMLGLQELMNQQVTARKAVENTQSAKDLANELQLIKVEQARDKNAEQVKTRANQDFDRLFKPLGSGSLRLQRIMNSLGLADLDQDKRIMLEEEIKTNVLEEYRKEDNKMSMVELLDPVTKAVIGKYNIDMNFIMDDEITLKNTEQKSSDLDTKFSDILTEFEKSKTKK
jgi:hypothetical protein